MRKRNYLPSIIVLIWTAFLLQGLSACSTLGYKNVDTSRTAIVVVIAEVRAANLLLQDLIGRRAISRFDAEDAHENLQDAHDQLQTALTAIDAGFDPALAETNLARANAALGFVLTILAPLVEN